MTNHAVSDIDAFCHEVLNAVSCLRGIDKRRLLFSIESAEHRKVQYKRIQDAVQMICECLKRQHGGGE